MLAPAALVAPVLFLAPTVATSNVPPTTPTYDLGDFDPPLPAFTRRLVAPTGRPGPGPLHALIAEPKGVTLRFRDLAVYLPRGEIGRAAMAPLVAEMFRRRAPQRLVPGSDATYAHLAEAVAAGRATRFVGAGSTAEIPPPVPSPSPFKPITEVQPQPSHGRGENRQAFDLLRVGPPLGDPVWIRAADGPLLVQPFTYRVLVWNPRTNALRTTALGDAAATATLIRDTPAAPPRWRA